VKRWVAQKLMQWAHTLDPTLPTVLRNKDGSHTISALGVPLAKINPGNIVHKRRVW